jgi:hypothetical protein
MPAPTSYTESALIGFMETELAETGEKLGLLETDGLMQAAWAVQRLLGVTNLSTETNMAKVEAAARWQAWKAAEAAAIARPSKLKSDGDELDYSQRLAGIRDRLSYAESDWYVALAAADAASGSGASFFGFAVIPGCRGR